MKVLINIILVALAAVLQFNNAEASSLDDLYRDIIRSDNRGYLPLFVKNRKEPVIITDESELPLPQNKTKNAGDLSVVNLSSDFQQRSVLAKAREVQWLKTIAAVKSNQVTPIELNDITTRVKENDPKATEILAWMYTNGVGVSADFIEAFNLYRKAAVLNVVNAERNALIVYKSMNDEQRRYVKSRNKTSYLPPL